MAKRSDQAPLDAIRLLLKSMTITLQPLTHQVSALPNESDLEYYFVPAEHMDLFSPYHRPGQPFKNLKLINFDRPAISLAFFPKHKYSIDRDVKPDHAQEVLLEYRDELFRRSFMGQFTPSQEKELQHIDSLLRSLRQSPGKFRFCISNYHHYYRYWYCSYRYFEDEERTKTGTSNEHMLKHTERDSRRVNKETIVSERLNIIFIDTKFITLPVPYDNKLISQELDTYSDRISFGKAELYMKSIE